MKSVIQEGSSLANAIEQGWIKAGKPKEFTIKIFQEARKNFFGITKLPAKVGIFFKEANDSKESKNDKKPQHRQQRSHSIYKQQQHNKPQQKKKFYNRTPRDRNDMQNRNAKPNQDFRKESNVDSNNNNKVDNKE